MDTIIGGGPQQPCPFCFGTRVMATQLELPDGLPGPFAIECACGASGPKGDTLAQAVERWDIREVRVRKRRETYATPSMKEALIKTIEGEKPN